MINEAKQAKAFVKFKISRLSDGKNEARVKSTLAMLRRGIGKPPGSMPELWDVTLDGLPEALLSKNGSPSYGEWAVHMALTLYALHQQGKDPAKQCVSTEGNFLGVSVRYLVAPDKSNEEAVRRRFNAAATSGSMEELANHLRSLVQLFKAANTTLDYPSLAEDIYWFQFPTARDSVRLRWGSDFYHVYKTDDENIMKDGNSNESE